MQICKANLSCSLTIFFTIFLVWEAIVMRRTRSCVREAKKGGVEWANPELPVQILASYGAKEEKSATNWNGRTSSTPGTTYCS